MLFYQKLIKESDDYNFNPSTQIEFSIPEAGEVTLKVYNTLGQTVAVLHEGFRQAGNYIATFEASELTSGVYFYRLATKNFIESKKLVLLK